MESRSAVHWQGTFTHPNDETSSLFLLHDITLQSQQVFFQDFVNQLVYGFLWKFYSKLHQQIYILQLTNFMFSLSEGNHWENDMRQSETTM